MATLDPFAPADPLGEALHFLRMNGAFYCRSELSAPWGLTLPPMPGYVWFHVVTSGALRLEADDGEPRLLGPGDLALVPHGEGHVLRSEPGAAAPGILDLERELVSDRYEILRHGGGGAPTTLICGAVRFDHPAAHNLVAILPRHDPRRGARTPAADWMQGTLRLMAAEARELRPGGEAVITRLGDILVIQAIRSWIETDPAARTGWLGALQDRADRPRAHADPPRPGARLDGGVARRRGGDVALGLRGPLHRARRRAGDAVRRRAGGCRSPSARCGARARPSPSSRAGSATDPRRPSPRVQARHRRLARRRGRAPRASAFAVAGQA